MNHATEPITTHDTNLAPFGSRRQPRAHRTRRREAERSMRPVAIVMVNEARDDVLEVLLVEDQQPVETLRWLAGCETACA